MKLSVTSWSFPQLSLSEVAGVVRAIGIGAIDIGFFYRSALDKAKVQAAPEAYGAEIREGLGVDIANLYYLFGSDTGERNLASGRHGDENRADFDKALAFCKAAGAPSVFILPGIINAGQGRREALANTIEALKPLVAAGQAAGVTVCVEPHVHSYLESPALAAALCEGVPGVKLALDYAHFAVSGYRQDEIDALAPHAGHIHMRQARPGALQTKMEEGTLNFPALFATLRDAGYDGYLACEYVNQAYFDTLHDDVLSETVKMRDAFLAWSAK